MIDLKNPNLLKKKLFEFLYENSVIFIGLTKKNENL